MANYATLKSAIQEVITTNGNREITGAIMQQSLLAMINSLGADYQFVGVATPSTNPGTPDQNVAYIAGSGTYPNFGNNTINPGYAGIFKYDGSWSLESFAVGKDYDSAIAALQNNKVTIKVGKNLFNPNATDITQNAYISSDGREISDSSKNISGYIPVTAQTAYHLSATGDTSVGVNYRAFYDSSKNLLSTQYQSDDAAGRSFTTPANCAYVRFTYVKTREDIMLEAGSERTEYLAYNEIGGYITDLVNKVFELNEEKVDKKVGRNLFNPNAPGVLTGKYISSTGSIQTNASYNVSDYIPVAAETTYHLSADGDSVVGANYRAFYDSNKTLLSVQYQNADQLVGKTFTTPASCAFVRFSYLASKTNVMLEIGVARSQYFAYNEIGGYLVDTIKIIEALQANKVDVKLGVNLWDGKIAQAGKYLDSSGTIKSNSTHSITEYIAVLAETDYCLSAKGNVGATSSSSMYLCYYDGNKNFLSSRSTNNKTFTTPATCAFIRFTIRNDRQEIMLEYGSTRSAYQPYTPIGGYFAVLQEKQVDYTNLNDALRELIGASVTRFDSLRGSGTLAAGESLTLLQNFVKKNILLVAHIEGAIENVKIGVGGTALTGYNGYYVELTATNVSVKRMDTGGTHATAAHGLTLTGHTTVYVDTRILDPTSVAADNTIGVNVTVCDNLGNTFVLNSDNYWGYGTPFITNGNSSDSLDVSLAFFPKDEIKDIWVFGDSYCEFTYLQKRLTYWLFLNGYTNFMLCAKGGMAQSDQLPVFQNLLGLGYKPAFAVWLLGMNDPSDTVSGGTATINGTAKTDLDSFIALCQSYDIVPILATIPTVPTRQHTGLSNYVKSLGLRYIDVAGAVGSDIDGNWYTGLLSEDGVHPTTAGSKVIFEQILIDFPEIATN